MVTGTFWQVIINTKLGVPDPLLPFFPMVRSVLSGIFFFTVIPRLTRTHHLKGATLWGFGAYLAGQLVLVAIPAPDGAATGSTYALLAVTLVLAIFAAIGYAFYRSPSLGVDALKNWILLTGGLSALGALIAGAHPLSIAGAFVAGPLKPFRPGIPSGAVSAMAEAWVRRPRVLDFERLRDDITHWTGWWKTAWRARCSTSSWSAWAPSPASTSPVSTLFAVCSEAGDGGWEAGARSRRACEGT